MAAADVERGTTTTRGPATATDAVAPADPGAVTGVARSFTVVGSWVELVVFGHGGGVTLQASCLRRAQGLGDMEDGGSEVLFLP